MYNVTTCYNAFQFQGLGLSSTFRSPYLETLDPNAHGYGLYTFVSTWQ